MLTDESRHTDFPCLGAMTYLNTAAEGIPPHCVTAALEQYARDKLLGMDGRLLHEKQWSGVREGAAKAFGLSPDEIGICSCSSEAFNLAALALQLKDNDEVIINEPFAEAHVLRPGDRFAAIINGRKRELTVVGTALSPEFIYALGPGALLPDDRVVAFGEYFPENRSVGIAVHGEASETRIPVGTGEERFPHWSQMN